MKYKLFNLQPQLEYDSITLKRVQRTANLKSKSSYLPYYERLEWLGLTDFVTDYRAAIIGENLYFLEVILLICYEFPKMFFDF